MERLGRGYRRAMGRRIGEVTGMVGEGEEGM